jgi:hypothetical protein
MNRMTGEEFLQSKDIWNHPTLTDRNNKECYDVAELLEEYATGEPKRKPLSYGILPLTKEEIQELSKIIGKRVELVGIVNDTIFISYFVESAGEYGGEETPSIRAIAYLLERFELTTNN